jgi:hypothetical protein
MPGMKKICFILILICFTISAFPAVWTNDTVIVKYNNSSKTSIFIGYNPQSSDNTGDTAFSLQITGTGIEFNEGNATITIPGGAILKSVFGNDTLATITAFSVFSINSLLTNGWDLTDGDTITLSGNNFRPKLLKLHTNNKNLNRTDSSGYKLRGSFLFDLLDWEYEIPGGIWYFKSGKEETLNSFTGTDTVDFHYQGYNFNQSVLRIGYIDTGVFRINGISDFIILNDTIEVSLGDTVSGKIGLQISNNKVDSLLFHVADTFKLKGLRLVTTNSFIRYKPADSSYIFYGDSLKAIISNSELDLGLGTESQPGGYLKGGGIDTLRFELLNAFSLFNLPFKGSNLVLEYESDIFKLYGGIDTVIFKHVSKDTSGIDTSAHNLCVDFGSSANPAVKIKDGKLDFADIGLSDVLTIDSINFTFLNNHIRYSKSDTSFSIYGGGIDVSGKHDSLFMALGSVDTPGFLIKDGHLEEINLQVLGGSKIMKLQFAGDKTDTVATFRYLSDSTCFSLFGSDTLIFIQQKDTITYKHELFVNFGSDSLPGITFKNGKLENVDLIVSGNLVVDSTKIMLKDNHLYYKQVADTFKTGISGEVKLQVKGQEIHLGMGNKDEPGIELINGHLNHINLGLFGGNHFLGVKIGGDTTKVVASCVWDNPTSEFRLFGNDNEPDTLIFSNIKQDSTGRDTSFHELIVGLGSELNPGLVIKSDSIFKVNISVTDTLMVDSARIAFINTHLWYDHDSAEFVLYGNEVDVMFKNNILKVGLGDSINPGLKIRDGELQHIRFSILDSTSVSGLTLLGKGLNFEYDKNKKEYSIYGGPDTLCFSHNRKTVENDSTLVIKDRHKLLVDFGTDSIPGIRFANGELLDVNLTITDRLTIDSVGLELDNIAFVYHKSENVFKMFGDTIKFLFKEDSLLLSFGNIDNPGIIIKDGELTHLHFSLLDTSELLGIKIIADSSDFEYDSDSSFYRLYCKQLAVEYSHKGKDSHDQDSVSVHKIVGSLGTQNNPGLKIKNGQLLHLNIGLTDTLKLSGVTLKIHDTHFVYDKENKYFEIFGGPVQLLLKNDSIAVDFGKEDDPGIVITDGVLDSINLGISTGGKLLGFEILSDNVHFKWNKSKNQFEVLGGKIKLKYKEDSILVDFSKTKEPVILIKDGKLVDFKGIITENFIISKLKIHTDSLGLYYDHVLNHFEFYGGEADIHFGEDSLEASFGNDLMPGLVIDKGEIKQVNIMASGHEKLFGLGCNIDSLTVQYNGTMNLFEVFGKKVQLILKGDTINGELGNAANPGMKIQNGELQEFTLGITADFKLKNLEIKPQDLVFSYDNVNKQIILYDSIDIIIDGKKIDCHLGNESNPGIIIKNGELKQLNIDISGSVHIGAMEFIVTDAGIQWPMEILHQTVSYNSNHKKIVTTTKTTHDSIAIYGDFKVKELWEAELNIGTSDQPGILIIQKDNHSTFKIEALSIELGEVNIGAAIIEEMKLNFYPDSIEVTCFLIVGNAFEAMGEIELLRKSLQENYKLNKIGIGFEILPPAEGIPLGATDIFLQGAQAKVNHLTDGKDLTISGDFQFSDGVSYDEHEGKPGFLMFMDAKGDVTKNYLDMSMNLKLGAYYYKGIWKSDIGEASLTADLNWFKNSYIFNGTVKIPTDYGVLINGDIILKENVKAFYGDVGIRIPSNWAVIGGMNLGDVGGAMLLYKNNRNASYAAGWTNFKVGCVSCDHWWCGGNWTKCLLNAQVGLGYNFGKSSFYRLGASDIDNVKKTVQSNLKSSGSSAIHAFELNITEESFGDILQAKISLDDSVSLADLEISVLGPDGIITPNIFIYDSLSGFYPISNYDFINGNIISSEVFLFFAETFEIDKFNNTFKLSNNALPKIVELEKGMYEFIIKTPSHITPKFETVINHSNILFDLETNFLNTENKVEFTTYSWIPQVKVEPEFDSVSHSIFYTTHRLNSSNSFKQNTADIKVFVDDDSLNFDGRLIVESLDTYEIKNNGLMVHKAEWAPFGHLNEKYYFYAVITDNLNAPVYSPYSIPFYIEPPIKGTIKNISEEGKAVNGITVFLDINRNGKLDLNGIPLDSSQLANMDSTSINNIVYDVVYAEPSAITDSLGNFHFDVHRFSKENIQPGLYPIEFYLHNGYSTAESTEYKRGDLVNYTGHPVQLIIQIMED